MNRAFCRNKRLVCLLCAFVILFLIVRLINTHGVLDKVHGNLKKQVSQSVHNLSRISFSLNKWVRSQRLSTAAKGNSDSRQPSKHQNKNQQPKRLLRQESGSLKRNRFPAATGRPRENEAEWNPPPNAGEEGVGVEVNKTQLSMEQKQKQQHIFNQFVSDHISLHRSLREVRDPACLSVQYPEDLPETSVVIIFHNEAWSTLLRTVHSVLDRSPPHLLRQVILVDDLSDLEHLKSPLDDYVSRLEKVKMLRIPERQGLIGARLYGFAHVTTPTVVFLDSHCECAEGWLEPMLDRIANDPTTVVVPVIDVVDQHTFRYEAFPVTYTHVGTFDWDLLFNWMPIQPSEILRRKSDIEPIRTPTMAGGLFAISTDYFIKLGTYDPGMMIWGGENLELSFKVWMCGGTMEVIPCSHVGHVFREGNPNRPEEFSDYLSVNRDRVAAVWMDDYRIYYKNFTSDDEESLDDISERLELRHRLKCHSFAWYMKNVMPERYVPADKIAHGLIKNNLIDVCIVLKDESVVLRDCTVDTQDWDMYVNESTIILYDTICLEYTEAGGVQTSPCHGQGGDQLWDYSQDLQQLYHVSSGLCAEASTDKQEYQYDGQDSFLLMMTQCHPSNPRQQWMWDTSPVPGPSWRKDLADGIPIDGVTLTVTSLGDVELEL